jgi:hypothetical protein
MKAGERGALPPDPPPEEPVVVPSLAPVPGAAGVVVLTSPGRPVWGVGVWAARGPAAAKRAATDIALKRIPVIAVCGPWSGREGVAPMTRTTDRVGFRARRAAAGVTAR